LDASQRDKETGFLEFDIDGDRYEQSAFVVPDLISDVILGADFLNENRVEILRTDVSRLREKMSCMTAQLR
jgi:hypothetical protein